MSRLLSLPRGALYLAQASALRFGHSVSKCPPARDIPPAGGVLSSHLLKEMSTQNGVSMVEVGNESKEGYHGRQLYQCHKRGFC